MGGGCFRYASSWKKWKKTRFVLFFCMFAFFCFILLIKGFYTALLWLLLVSGNLEKKFSCMITIVFGTAIYIRYIGLEMQKFLDVWTGKSQELMSRPHVALLLSFYYLEQIGIFCWGINWMYRFSMESTFQFLLVNSNPRKQMNPTRILFLPKWRPLQLRFPPEKYWTKSDGNVGKEFTSYQ